MKLAEGGFPPAYNMQIVSAPQGQLFVAVDIDITGSDRGLARPAPEGLGAAGTRPSDYLVDGGFTKDDDIEWAHQSGIKLWCPPVYSKHGSDPCAPRRDDKPGVADWPHGSSPWAEGPGGWRASPAKRSTRNARRPNAPMPGRAAWGSPGCWCVKDKARAVLLWFALAHNMLRTFTLRCAAMTVTI